MPTLVGYGDRLITPTGRRSWLKRPSVPLSYYAGGGSIDLSSGGAISFQLLYETQPWVAIAVNKLNRQIGRLPLKTYRQQENGERERVRDHALPQLLGNPYPRAGAIQLKQKAAFPALLHGNGCLWKVREAPGAPPSQLLPLDWRYLNPHSTAPGQVDVWETTETGGSRYIAPDEVVHFAFEGGTGEIGVSPLKQLGVTLRVEDAAQRYQSSSFDNGVRPATGYVVPADVRLGTDERDELRQELRAQHEGVDNAFRIALLTGGGKLETYSHTAVEAELIDQRKLNREEVAAVYDIPPPLVGILDHATYSNVAEMHRMLYGMVLGPWLVLIEETLKAQLIDPEPAWEGLFVEFDLAEVLKGDTLKEVLAIKEAIATGIMSPNEGRQIRNAARSDDPGADKLYLPINNLGPIDGADGGPPPPDEETQGTLKSHLERVVQRVSTKMGAGEDPWDRDRFIRELKADLDGDLNGTADAFASAWADALEALIADADGPAELRAFLSALT